MAASRWRSLQHTFVTGVLLLAPLAVTAEIVKAMVDWVEEHSPFGFWGGLGIALAVIFLVGWISRSALGPLLSTAEDLLVKVPGVGQIYGYLRDMVQGLGGEERFRQPVWVHPYPRSKLRMIGFVTREDLSVLGVKGDVAVFLAMGYGISGFLVVVPRSQVRPVQTGAKDLLAFVATGGLAGAHVRKDRPGEPRGR